MEASQILSKKKYGDIRFVAEIIGESHRNTDRILRRPTAKKHKQAIQVLGKLIESREQMIKESANTIDQ
jgi:hypothetical protein